MYFPTIVFLWHACVKRQDKKCLRQSTSVNLHINFIFFTCNYSTVVVIYNKPINLTFIQHIGNNYGNKGITTHWFVYGKYQCVAVYSKLFLITCFNWYFMELRLTFFSVKRCWQGKEENGLLKSKFSRFTTKKVWRLTKKSVRKGWKWEWSLWWHGELLLRIKPR